MPIDELVRKLNEKKITVYEAVELIKRKPETYQKSLQKILVEDENDFFRLFAAWALGEIKDLNSFDLLVRQYDIEKDDNVRTNVVRAILLIEPGRISKELVLKFIIDPYYPIPLMAIKFLIFNSDIHNKLDFLPIYKNCRSTLQKIELLRNIRLFALDKNLLEFLAGELNKEEKIFIKSSLIQAICYINHPDSLTVLCDYYNGHKDDFRKYDLLAFSFARGNTFLCQSKAYDILDVLYFTHENLAVKRQVIEALICAGGPKCLQVLKKIMKLEKRSILLDLVEEYINKVKITEI